MTPEERYAKAIGWYIQELLYFESNQRKRHLYSKPLEELKTSLDRTTQTCFEYGLEQYQPRNRMWNWKPRGKRKQKLEDFCRYSAYLWRSYRTPETKFLGKIRFFKEGFFFKDRKHQSFWLKPDDKHTRLPERAWDAWCREYDKFYKEKLNVRN